MESGTLLRVLSFKPYFLNRLSPRIRRIAAEKKSDKAFSIGLRTVIQNSSLSCRRFRQCSTVHDAAAFIPKIL